MSDGSYYVLRVYVLGDRLGFAIGDPLQSLITSYLTQDN